MSDKRLIDANVLREQWLYGGLNENIYNTNDFLNSIDNIPTIDAIPRYELINLRNNLYYEDAITMDGLSQLNALIGKYTRRIDDD